MIILNIIFLIVLCLPCLAIAYYFSMLMAKGFKKMPFGLRLSICIINSAAISQGYMLIKMFIINEYFFNSTAGQLLILISYSLLGIFLFLIFNRRKINFKDNDSY